jgi:hypothetical protein
MMNIESWETVIHKKRVSNKVSRFTTELDVGDYIYSELNFCSYDSIRQCRNNNCNLIHLDRKMPLHNMLYECFNNPYLIFKKDTGSFIRILNTILFQFNISMDKYYVSKNACKMCLKYFLNRECNNPHITIPIKINNINIDFDVCLEVTNNYYKISFHYDIKISVKTSGIVLSPISLNSKYIIFEVKSDPEITEIQNGNFPVLESNDTHKTDMYDKDITNVWSSVNMTTVKEMNDMYSISNFKRKSKSFDSSQLNTNTITETKEDYMNDNYSLKNEDNEDNEDNDSLKNEDNEDNEDNDSLNSIYLDINDDMLNREIIRICIESNMFDLNRNKDLNEDDRIGKIFNLKNRSNEELIKIVLLLSNKYKKIHDKNNYLMDKHMSSVLQNCTFNNSLKNI